jgi:hypothetical protein
MSELEPLFYDVKSFCEAARIGKRTFYSLKSQGKAPMVTKIGDRNLISVEDARAWRTKMKVETLKNVVDVARAAEAAQPAKEPQAA